MYRLVTIWCSYVVVLCACASDPKGNVSEGMYLRLGGEAGITNIVNNFLYQVGDSELLRPHFADVNLNRFHEKFSEQLCEISGGPCRYTGDSMTEVHAGLVMNNGHFDAVVTALINAMEQEGIDVGTQNALLEKLAAMHADVMAETVKQAAKWN